MAPDQRLVAALAPLPGVRSVRFVGSYWSSDGAQNPADVDVVVIVDTLTQDRFEACVVAVGTLSGEDFGRPGAVVRVNSTFGPRKVGDPGDVVVHLMIYDVAAHRAHVLASPFTCLDWEREERGYGPSLRETFAVPPLSPAALANARRGTADYLRDLDSGTMSVRRYEWDGNGPPRTVVDRVPLDDRNRGTFALHIARHLITNYRKVMTGRNESLSDDELRAAWDELVPGWSSLQTRELAERAGEAIASRVSALPRIVFVRHAETTVKDGSFLGRGRDPGIDPPEPLLQLVDKVNHLLVSPLRRTRETAAQLAPGVLATTDPRLSEIDYGDAEGLRVDELAQRFPEITAAWNRGEDPPFPRGENTADVDARVQQLLRELAGQPGTTLVVTHNVVMRCVLGRLFDVPSAQWHRIVVSYLGLVELYCMGDRIVPSVEPDWLGEILDLRSAS